MLFWANPVQLKPTDWAVIVKSQKGTAESIQRGTSFVFRFDMFLRDVVENLRRLSLKRAWRCRMLPTGIAVTDRYQ